MHLEICPPGTSLHNNQQVCYLLNSMCDLTQLLIQPITTDTKTQSIDKFFMEEFVLSFTMVSVLVVDTGSRFRGAFEGMCKCLQIIFCNLAHVNHKGNSVEKYHRILNKTQDNEGQDHGSHDILIKNKKSLVCMEHQPNQ